MKLCQELGILINFDKSHLSPSQTSTFLGMVIASQTMKTFPSQERVRMLLSQIEEFLSSSDKAWFVGGASWVVCSLCLLVSEGHLRMRSFLLTFRDLWDFLDESVSVVCTPSNKQDLLWGSDVQILLAGVSLEPQHQDLLSWSNASYLGCGANLVDQFVSGLWSGEEKAMSINMRELQAIRLGLPSFSAFSKGLVCGDLFRQHCSSLIPQEKRRDIFEDPQCRSSASPVLGRVHEQFSFAPVHHGGEECRSQFPEPSPSGFDFRMDLGSDSGGQVMGQVASHSRSVCHLSQLSPTSLLFPSQRPHGSETDAFLQNWDGLQAYAFPSFSLIHQVLNKLRSCKGTAITLIAPYRCQKQWFPDLPSLSVASPVDLPCRADLLRQPYFHYLH